MTEPQSAPPPCMCRLPYPGPMHWDWRCLTCGGTVPSMWERFKRELMFWFGRTPR